MKNGFFSNAFKEAKRMIDEAETVRIDQGKR